MQDLFKNLKIFDISPPLDETSPVFPGDIPFKRQVLLTWKKGNHLELSGIHSTLHLGAHADAPLHYHPQGDSIEKRDLSKYLGLTQVIEIETKGEWSINLKHWGQRSILAPRILFKTQSFPSDGPWRDQFCFLSGELIDFLVSQTKVELLGIDTPSVDDANSKDLPSHQKLFQNNLAVLEGLDLSSVSEGLYQLVALPLKFVGADASLVRAILLQ